MHVVLQVATMEAMMGNTARTELVVNACDTAHKELAVDACDTARTGSAVPLVDAGQMDALLMNAGQMDDFDLEVTSHALCLRAIFICTLPSAHPAMHHAFGPSSHASCLRAIQYMFILSCMSVCR